MSGEASRATESECWRPRVRGETPTTTNDTRAITPMAMSSRFQKPSTRSMAPSVMRTAVVDSATTRRNAVTDRYAALSATMRDSALAPGRRSSSSSWARTRDIRQRAASAAESRKAAATLTSATKTSPVMTAPSGGGTPAGREEGQQQLPLELEHLALLLGFRVVVAEQVQDPVRGQQQELLLGRVTGVGSLLGRHRRTEHDVAEHTLLGLLALTA